eukprot:scpid42465/ scgid23245/ 
MPRDNQVMQVVSSTKRHILTLSVTFSLRPGRVGGGQMQHSTLDKRCLPKCIRFRRRFQTPADCTLECPAPASSREWPVVRAWKALCVFYRQRPVRSESAVVVEGSGLLAGRISSTPA